MRPEAVYSNTVGVIIDQARGPQQGILTVKRGESTTSHDLQLRYGRGENYAAVTGFYMTIHDYISFDANNVPQGYKNLGDVRSIGTEMEGRYYLVPRTLAAAGNYSYAHAKLNNNNNPGAISDNTGETLNYPQHIWNVGLDWFLNMNQSFNANINGWALMPIELPLAVANTATPQYAVLKGESYLDFSYSYKGVFRTPINLTAFVTNVFDNTHAIGMAVNNGWFNPRGRNIGASLAYKW